VILQGCPAGLAAVQWKFSQNKQLHVAAAAAADLLSQAARSSVDFFFQSSRGGGVMQSQTVSLVNIIYFEVDGSTSCSSQLVAPGSHGLAGFRHFRSSNFLFSSILIKLPLRRVMQGIRLRPE
jgi:hypothetical protein